MPTINGPRHRTVRRGTKANVVVAVCIGILAVGATAGALPISGKVASKAKAKVGPPTWVVNMQVHGVATGDKGDRGTVDLSIDQAVFVGALVNSPQYTSGPATAGTFTESWTESGECSSNKAAGSGPVASNDPEIRTSVSFFLHKGARIGVIDVPQPAMKVTESTPTCGQRPPLEVGAQLVSDLQIYVDRCDGLPIVNRGPGGPLSKTTPLKFKFSCTASGAKPVSDGWTTTGTVSGDVTYTGPTPNLASYVTAG